MNKTNKNNLIRYIQLWPFLLISLFIFLILGFLFLRYSPIIYNSTAKIQILDDAMDSDMALPTAMTIFNRSMINLENDIEILKSQRVLKEAINSTNSYTRLYELGNISTKIISPEDWLNGKYTLDFSNFDFDSNEKRQDFDLIFEEEILKINKFIEGEFIDEYIFNSFEVKPIDGIFPFYFNFSKAEYNELNYKNFRISILPFEDIFSEISSSLKVNQIGSDSDLLEISYNHSNSKIAENFINELILHFDNDGISDRRMVFKRTIDFVSSRFDTLKSELENIEVVKQKLKEDTNFNYLEIDSKLSLEQSLIYDAELFNFNSQYELSNLLLSSIDNEIFEYMPVNIGIENQSVNDLISDYNEKISERNTKLKVTGNKNSYVKNLNSEIAKVRSNVKNSILNYLDLLDAQITNIENKENEFKVSYNLIPENERLLRSINREQEIKEALFLLLLQKKEEASINYAVVKPSIKVIDYAVTSAYPISPNKSLIYLLFSIIGVIAPIAFFELWSLFDTKIHSRDDFDNIIDAPIIGEVPNKKNLKNEFPDPFSRNPVAESIRIIIANFNLLREKVKDNKIAINGNNNNKNVILVTSSVKGEGKTLLSTYLSSLLSYNDKKVLLIGADLRNPQIHKYLNISKSDYKGLSDYIMRDDLKWKDLLVTKDKLDILLSGSIPPNPTLILNSEKLNTLLNEVSQIYDFIIVDSSPTLLVSDTFIISKYINYSIYVCRVGHTDKSIIDYIKNIFNEEKLNNPYLVLNDVGSKNKYGYNYSYNYSYSYNYGYGYGYSEDEN